jgi:hypothetical protein
MVVLKNARILAFSHSVGLCGRRDNEKEKDRRYYLVHHGAVTRMLYQSMIFA